MSHRATCLMNDAQTEVTEIVDVHSVDLVDDPGTTNTLFEETEMSEGLAELKQMLDDQRTKLDEMKAHADAFNQRMEVLETKEAKPDPKRLALLEKIEPIEGEPTIGNTHEDFLGAVLGFPVTN